MINRLLKTQAFVLPVFVVLFFVIEKFELFAVATGFLLSFLFVISSTLIINKFWKREEPTFLKAFIFSIPIRFFIVLSVFIILLVITKIDEIYFTVSFIISYLYHSITETIFINNILDKGSSNS